jgi:hypothetical protein
MSGKFKSLAAYLLVHRVCSFLPFSYAASQRGGEICKPVLARRPIPRFV